MAETNASAALFVLVETLNGSIQRLRTTAAFLEKTQHRLDSFDIGIPRTDEFLRANAHRLVSVDQVVMCMHLMTARVAFKSYAGICRDQLISFGTKGVNTLNTIVGAGTPIMYRLSTFIGWITTLLTFVWEAIKNDLLVQKVREEGLVVRRELRTGQLKGHGIRKRKVVSSRHPSPRQRKKNRNWRSA